MNNPVALRSGYSLSEDNRIVSSLSSDSPSGEDQSILLPPLEAWVWSHADGSRTVADLARDAGRDLGVAIDLDMLWRALDLLADEGLLAERVTPPGSETRVSRRQMLSLFHTSVASAVGLVLLGPVPAQAGEYDSKESSSKESRSKDNNRESSSKESRSKDNSRESSSKESRSKDNSRTQGSKESRSKDNSRAQGSKESRSKTKRKQDERSDQRREHDRREQARKADAREQSTKSGR